MLLQELESILTNRLAPKIYRLDSEIYGLQYSQGKSNKSLKKVLLTIDLSIEALHCALQNKVNLIISHHGLVNNPINKFNQNLIKKLVLLSKYPISIFVLNSPFIAAEGGISETLAKVLYLESVQAFYIKNDKGVKVPIGRICAPKFYPPENKKLSLEDLVYRFTTSFNISSVRDVGDLKKKIRKICIVGGNHPDINFLTKALNSGCDCYISGEISYLDAVYGRDIGLSLIEAPHHEIATVTLNKLCNILSLEFPYVEFFLFESKNPFKTFI
ncbi:MAG: Nif3-like dinuclear metal center hexameric protein [Promethearchaeota archaeon]|jgi:dinuclear metal center YbgI/SA1388 family protein